jgi:hypothetical protein
MDSGIDIGYNFGLELSLETGTQETCLDTGRSIECSRFKIRTAREI